MSKLGKKKIYRYKGEIFIRKRGRPRKETNGHNNHAV